MTNLQVNAKRILTVASSNTPILINLTSQGLGLIQYLVLISWVGASRTSDFFFLVLAWSSLPMQLVVTGVVFPLLLRGAVDSAARWLQIAQLLIPLSLAVPVAVFWTFIALVKLPIAIMLLTAAYSWCVLQVTAEGFRRAVAGDALVLSAATLWGTLGSITGLAMGMVIAPDMSVPLMLAAGVLGQGAFLWILAGHTAGRRRGRDSLAEQPAVADPPKQSATDSGWYLGKAAAGYGGGIALQSFSAFMPAAFLTYFSVFQRLIGGVASAFSNSVLPRYVHVDTVSPTAAVRLTGRVVVVVLGLGLAASLCCFSVGRPVLAGWCLIATAWCVAALCGATIQRLTYRLLPPSNALIPIVICILTLGIVSTAFAFGYRSPSIILLAVVALDGATSVLLLRKLDLAKASWALGGILVGVVLTGLAFVNL